MAKALGFADASAGNVTVVYINGGKLEYTAAETAYGLGGGQTIYMTGGTIQSNGGVSSTTSAYYRFLNNGPDPTIYTLASSSTATIAGRVHLSNSGTFNTENGTATTDLLVSAGITGANGITKSGAGLMQLTGANTYTGGTTISGGVLNIDFQGNQTQSAVGVAGVGHGEWRDPPHEQDGWPWLLRCQPQHADHQ